MYIQIDERDNKNVILHCIITVKESSQQCKKTYLREPTRKKYAAEAATKSVEALRAEIAYKLMEPGDPEPPHLPKSNVLHVAKSNYVASRHLHSDPTIAIGLLKKELKNVIHRTGSDPFFVHYHTTHQRNLYNRYVKSGEVTQVFIDASGGF